MYGCGGVTSGLLGVGEGGTATPRTPEILNSLISMTSPFDRLRPPPPGGCSPTGSDSCGSPPSVQHTCSQLIKEGLKLTLQTKRRTTNSPGPAHQLIRSDTPDSQHCDTSNDGLTPEDEERRRRRRERNKIAATKCRQKKRERTTNLVYESEVLETQNLDLKSKIQALESQRRELVEVLTVHQPACNKSSTASSSSASTSASASSSSSSVYQELSRSSSGMSVGHGRAHSHSHSSPYQSEVGASHGHGSFSEVLCTTRESYHQHQHHTEELSLSYTSQYRDLYRERQLHHYPVSTSHMGRGRNDDSQAVQQADRRGGGYPLRMAASTSSSDYESNTELVDSPSAPGSSYQFPQDPTSFSPTSVFPAQSSCIT